MVNEDQEKTDILWRFPVSINICMHPNRHAHTLVVTYRIMGRSVMFSLNESESSRFLDDLNNKNYERISISLENVHGSRPITIGPDGGIVTGPETATVADFKIKGIGNENLSNPITIYNDTKEADNFWALINESVDRAR